MKSIFDNEWPYPVLNQSCWALKMAMKKKSSTLIQKTLKMNLFAVRQPFSIEVQSVKALELPEIDEDFLKLLGDFESEGDFREKLEQQLRAEHREL